MRRILPLLLPGTLLAAATIEFDDVKGATYRLWVPDDQQAPRDGWVMLNGDDQDLRGHADSSWLGTITARFTAGTARDHGTWTADAVLPTIVAADLSTGDPSISAWFLDAGTTRAWRAEQARIEPLSAARPFNTPLAITQPNPYWGVTAGEPLLLTVDDPGSGPYTQVEWFDGVISPGHLTAPTGATATGHAWSLTTTPEPGVRSLTVQATSRLPVTA